MSELIHTFNLSRKPIMKAGAILSAQIMPVSRLRYKPDLIQIKSVHSIPQIPSSFSLNFREVALNQASRLWSGHSQNGILNILWSGGIDSTVALVALLMTLPKGNKIAVYCNLSSIIENPDFYQNLLQNSDVILRNSSMLHDGEAQTFITGDLGDQVFGSELLFRISREFGFENLQLPYEKVVPELFRRNCGSEGGAFLYERYHPIVNESPFPIRTAFDFVWWWNFTQKWQGVAFRKKCFFEPEHRFIHFFESEDFQLWSIFSHEKKIGSRLETYKLPAKEMIYEYDRNENYFKYKKKTSSPFGDKVVFYAQFEDGRRITDWSENIREIENRSLI